MLDYLAKSSDLTGIFSSIWWQEDPFFTSWEKQAASGGVSITSSFWPCLDLRHLNQKQYSIREKNKITQVFWYGPSSEPAFVWGGPLCLCSGVLVRNPWYGIWQLSWVGVRVRAARSTTLMSVGGQSGGPAVVSIPACRSGLLMKSFFLGFTCFSTSNRPAHYLFPFLLLCLSHPTALVCFLRRGFYPESRLKTISRLFSLLSFFRSSYWRQAGGLL